MMNFSALLTQVSAAGLGILAVALVLSFVRLRKGPTLADRVLALDLMTTILMGMFGVYAIYSRQEVFVDVTIVLALIAFVSTVVYAKHIDRDAARHDEREGVEP